jgi:hypothetical protein
MLAVRIVLLKMVNFILNNTLSSWRIDRWENKCSAIAYDVTIIAAPLPMMGKYLQRHCLPEKPARAARCPDSQTVEHGPGK